MQTGTVSVVSLFWIGVAFAQPRAAVTPPKISISICGQTGSAQGSCPTGAFDTAQPVLSHGKPINTYEGLTSLTDEHITIFPKNYPDSSYPAAGKYLFFVASRTALNPLSSGLVTLSSSGPEKGQWTLDFAFGDPNVTGVGQTFLSPMKHDNCPAKDNSDRTFDLNYANPGSVIIDPTGGSFNPIMIYEGTNRCIGTDLEGKAGNAYSTIGIATSDDRALRWPSYLTNHVDLPQQNGSLGPQAALGAEGAWVCHYNNCNNLFLTKYGRYAVLSPTVSVENAMASSGTHLKNNMGDSQPSAFVDDVDGSAQPYLYVVHNYLPGPSGLGGCLYDRQFGHDLNSDLTVARARLGSGFPPRFTKWLGTFDLTTIYRLCPPSPAIALSNEGLGGLEAPIFTVNAQKSANCLAPGQKRVMGSISYINPLKTYLLTFVCEANQDPGGITPAAPGAAWFFSTSSDLSTQEWSDPLEIAGSWAAYTPDAENGSSDPECMAYPGWYPSFMTRDFNPGRLSTTGFVFYMKGCANTVTNPPRQFSSREFTITVQ